MYCCAWKLPLVTPQGASLLAWALYAIFIRNHFKRNGYTLIHGGVPFPYPWETGGARTALHVELFPSLLSSEVAFSVVVDSLVEENFPGSNPSDSQINMVLLGD